MNIKGSLLQFINLHINVTFTNHYTKLYTHHNLFKPCKNTCEEGDGRTREMVQWVKH